MEQEIWQAVLVRLVRDLMSSGYSNASVREDAERWVGSFPSSDFRMVCLLAGYDHLRVHRVLKSTCAIAPEERSQFLESLENRESSTGRWTAPEVAVKQRGDAIAA